MLVNKLSGSIHWRSESKTNLIQTCAYKTIRFRTPNLKVYVLREIKLFFIFFMIIEIFLILLKKY